KSHGGEFLPSNGIAMSRDIHWAFDKGFFSLKDDYSIIVHPKTTSNYLHSFDGKKIKLPSDSFFVPDVANLKYHRENVYGLFLTTGRL
ncbi:MAG: HNH endonuclease, partial [Oscillospiraceae bacterium]